MIPKHIAIICDGNRRWAEAREIPSIWGHVKGLRRLVSIVKHCRSMDVQVLTVFGFSTENWKRSHHEINYLMKIFEIFARRHSKKMHALGIRIRVLGDISAFPLCLQQQITEAVALTSSNKQMQLNVALNYGGRAEIIRAINRTLNAIPAIDHVNEEMLAANLDTCLLPDPDLIIRTGGEMRLSNFLLWQAAYSELYFTEKLWPDFLESDLNLAMQEYAGRRRFLGK